MERVIAGRVVAVNGAANQGQLHQHKAAFNKMAWELSLYLPAKIICDMAQTLINGKGSILDLLIAVRKYLLHDENDPLIANNILNIP